MVSRSPVVKEINSKRGVNCETCRLAAQMILENVSDRFNIDLLDVWKIGSNGLFDRINSLDQLR
jgi:hypothetical protein